MQSLSKRIEAALARRWAGLLAQVIAVALVWGALVLLWAALGLSRAWDGVPTPARVLDVLLIPFNVAVAIGLWRLQAWSVFALYGGAVLLQLLPYLALRGAFVADPQVGIAINSLLVFEVATLILFAAVIARTR